MLDRVSVFRGLPRAPRSAQGPEFSGSALVRWAYRNRVTLRLLQAGKPTTNPYVESFSGTFRHTCLIEHWLRSRAEAHEIIGAWRADYNQRRPHSTLGYRTPARVRRRLACPVCRGPQAGSTHIGYVHQQRLYELSAGAKKDSGHCRYSSRYRRSI